MVIVPLYKENLTRDEEISLRQLSKIIKCDKIFVICPMGLKIPSIASNWGKRYFSREYFENINGYNSLMLSAEFYASFYDYQYMLIYQLDCLIFSDELIKWSKKDYSYVASPWFANFWNDPALGLWKVGNGGFSMRKISSALKVLGMIVPKGTLKSAGQRAAYSYIDSLNPSNHYRAMYDEEDHNVNKLVTVEEDVREYPLNEDLFWSFEAPQLDPTFRIPEANEALTFGFEKCPEWCFSENGNQLPMGCHAWFREGREFWVKFLSPEILS